MVVEYSDASMGKVAPADPAFKPLFNVPSASTITQLLPVAPGVVVKMKPEKLVVEENPLAAMPVTPACEALVPPVPGKLPLPVVFQNEAVTPALLLNPTTPPALAVLPVTIPVA